MFFTLNAHWYYFTIHIRVLKERFDNHGAVCIIMSLNFTNKWLFKVNLNPFVVACFIDNRDVGKRIRTSQAFRLYFPCCMSRLVFTTRWSCGDITLTWSSGSKSERLHGAVAPWGVSRKGQRSHKILMFRQIKMSQQLHHLHFWITFSNATNHKI